MTLARARSERLILAPSMSLMPLFSVAVPRSEPARSMSDNLPVSVSTVIVLVLGLLESSTWKTAWLLELVWLALVASVVLLLLPFSNNCMTCSVDSALHSVTPAMMSP